MGYYAHIADHSVKISEKNFREALRIIDSMDAVDWKRSMSVPEDASLMDELIIRLEEIRYDFTPVSSIDKGPEWVEMEGFDGEKYGSDEMIWSMLSRVIDAGSYINWVGEDGTHWKFCFDGHSMQILQGRMVYE